MSDEKAFAPLSNQTSKPGKSVTPPEVPTPPVYTTLRSAWAPPHLLRIDTARTHSGGNPNTSEDVNYRLADS